MKIKEARICNDFSGKLLEEFILLRQILRNVDIKIGRKIRDVKLIIHHHFHRQRQIEQKTPNERKIGFFQDKMRKSLLFFSFLDEKTKTNNVNRVKSGKLLSFGGREENKSVNISMIMERSQEQRKENRANIQIKPTQ